VALELPAGLLFSRLRELSERPLTRGTKADVCWHAVIEFPTDEEAHNDDLQAAARAFADSILALVRAGARDVWGEPDYNLSCADEDLPAWAEDLPNGPGFERLVGWRRGRTLVAFALREQQDRETPIFVFVGVVRWRAGALANEEKQRGRESN
jgi:hypothetical protein